MLDSPIPRSSEVVNMAVECSCGWRFSFKPPGCSVSLMHSQITPEAVTPVKPPQQESHVTNGHILEVRSGPFRSGYMLNWAEDKRPKSLHLPGDRQEDPGTLSHVSYDIPWIPRCFWTRYHVSLPPGPPCAGPSRGGESLHPSPATAHALCSTMDWANQGARAQSGGDVATRVRYVLISKSTRI